MVLNNQSQVQELFATVDKCSGEVWLESSYGDRFSLKSKLMRYIAIGRMLEDDGGNLSLCCEKREDEQHLLKFFHDNPDTI